MFSRNLEFLNNLALKSRLERITLEESSKNMSYCMTPSNDYLLMKDDVPFDDINNPREAIKETLKSTVKNPMGNNDIIITFGIGLCYMLDEVYNTYPSRIIVYEPDINVLHFVLNNVDISEHLASGRVFITDNLDELMKKLSEIYITKDKVEVVYLKNYAIVKSPELMALTQKVYETCRSKIVDVNTITKYSKKWLLNTLRNINLINNNSSVFKLSDLKNKFSGQTALIIAAGPSLNENLDKIKANRDKFVIFAVNKVLRVLSANEIVPDFTVCLDASSINSTLTGLEEFCAKTNCIMDIKSDSVLFTKNFKRMFMSFSKNDMVVKKLADYNKLECYESGGTATALALVAAVKLGFSKIIFTGLDMAFQNEVIYSTGEVMNKVSDTQMIVGKTQKKIVKVKSVTGDLVYTREDYAAFIQHFETLIKDLECKEIYNTTSFGAAIEGMKNVSFDELPLFFSSTGTPFILGEAKPFKLEIEEWAKEELMLINNVISVLSKGVFSPALVSTIVKSPLMYQYMQADILKVLQSNFESGYADEFIEKAKAAIKVIVENLQKNRLI